MKITVDVADEVYTALMAAHTTRIRGSITLTSPKHGNFRAWRTNTRTGENRQYIKLPHGRASVGAENVRLTLHINRSETGIIPQDAILSESASASVFIEKVI